MIDAATLLHFVPFGEENAATARLIWEAVGEWTSASIKIKLNELAADGLIERKMILGVRGAPANAYFRKSDT